jgi:putative peptide zinc metalloprotease protein
MLEVSPLAHEVAAHLDGRRHLTDVASRVAAAVGRPVSAESVAYLIDQKLRPAGIVAAGQCRFPPTASHQPVLGVAVHRRVLPEATVRALARLLRPLFLPIVVLETLLGLLTVDVVLLHGAGRQLLALPTRPAAVLVVVALTLASGLFHELGHATASRYGGAEPGEIGVGVYLIWPVFYNDLNDSYRLSRTARLRADLGGVYFNAIFVLALAAAYRITGFEPLLVAILVQHLAVAQQFLPFVRLDGYYVVSDLAGVPDLFGHVRPSLAALLPGRKPSVAASRLTSRARRIVRAWVFTTVPLLTACLLLVAVHLPSAVMASWLAFAGAGASLFQAAGDLDAARALLAGLQLLLLAVPFVGMAALLLRVSRGCRGAVASLRGR